MTSFPVPVELTDAELDGVAAGASQNGIQNGGLVQVQNVSVLDNADVNVAVNANVLGNAAQGVFQQV